MVLRRLGSSILQTSTSAFARGAAWTVFAMNMFAQLLLSPKSVPEGTGNAAIGGDQSDVGRATEGGLVTSSYVAIEA